VQSILYDTEPAALAQRLAELQRLLAALQGRSQELLVRLHDGDAFERRAVDLARAALRDLQRQRQQAALQAQGAKASTQ
jgi:hypothetical protein